MLASMRSGRWLALISLSFLPGLGMSACLGDEEQLDGRPEPGGAAGAGAGSGSTAGSGGSGSVLPPGLGGYSGELPVGAGGDTGGSAPGSGGQAGPPGLPMRVTGSDQPCSIDLTRSEASPSIGTVGIVEFAASWAVPDTTATIEFGKSTSYGMTAPVLLAASGAKALLVGMTTATPYHYRIVLRRGAETCVSQDLTLLTGPMPAGSSIGNAIVTEGPSSHGFSPGYFVGSNYNGNWVFILNAAGELVWFYETPINNISSVRLAPDGGHVYARTLNVARKPENGRVVKIAIDGSSLEEILLTSSHHDFDFGPDGSLVYLRKSLENSCDSVFLHWLDDTDDSQDELIADLDPFFTVPGPNMMLGSETCHANSVHYYADSGYTVSDLVHNAYVKLDDLGQLEWMLGGGVDSTFVGEGSVWSRQHGHQLLAPDRLLFFNNQTAAEKTSRALEVTFDLVGGAATYAPFEYGVEGLSSQVLGDVRRLPNGNTLVTYSVGAGLLHEVDPYGDLVRSIDFPGGPCGYTDFRESLYAPSE
jgi:hypothetical protein